MKKVLLGIAAVLLVIVAGLMLYLFSLDFNDYKPQIVQAVKDASGLELVIEGDISPSFSPVGLSLGELKVSNPQSFDKQPFFTLKSFDVAVELLPLLSREVKVQYVELSDIDLNIIRSKKGVLNAAVQPSAEAEREKTEQQEPAEKTELPLVMVDRVLLSNANITYTDLATGAKAKVNDIELVVTNINFDATRQGIKAVAFDGALDIAEVIYEKYVLSKIDADFALQDAIATVSNLDYSIFGSRATGSAVIDLSGREPKITLQEKIPSLNLAVLAKTLAGKDMLEGTVDTLVDLNFRGSDAAAMKKSLQGKIAVVGKNVGVIGYDLDKVLGQYDKSQGVGAADVAAFLVAGPVGTLLTKGGDIGGAFAGMKGGKTLLKDVVLKTEINKGQAELTDVAVATNKNRLAVKGTLDLPRDQFRDVSVGVLENNGCAKYSQTITGSFDKPGIKVDQAAVSQVTNMVGSIFKKVKGVAGGSERQECTTPFYNGSVDHPVQ